MGESGTLLPTHDDEAVMNGAPESCDGWIPESCRCRRVVAVKLWMSRDSGAGIF
jgi:hypothetical protein